jgi:hypothetical protein
MIIFFIVDSFIFLCKQTLNFLSVYFYFILNKSILFLKDVFTVFYDLKNYLQSSILNFFQKYIIDLLIDIKNFFQDFYNQLDSYTIKILLFQKDIDFSIDNLGNNILLIFTTSILTFILLLILFNLKLIIKFILLGIIYLFFFILNIFYSLFIINLAHSSFENSSQNLFFIDQI